MVRGFVHFHQAHVFTAGNGHDNALCTLHRHTVEQRISNRAFRRLKRTAIAFGFACAHHRLAHFVHDGPDVGKIQVDQARHDHEISDAAHALLQNFVGQQECLFERRIRVSDQKQVLVWNNNERVHMLLQLGNARFCRAHPPRTFEKERLCYHANGQYVHFARSLGNHRRSTGSGSATHTRCDEAHVATCQSGLHLFNGFFCSGASNLRARTSTKTLRNLRTKLNTIIRRRSVQCLRIGVSDDEIDAFHLRANHIGNRVTAGTANTNHCNFRLQFVNHGWSDIDAHNFIPLASLACSKFAFFWHKSMRGTSENYPFCTGFCRAMTANIAASRFKAILTP